eukprot:5427927-Alexandrium_andersonii.AAC.1
MPSRTHLLEHGGPTFDLLGRKQTTNNTPRTAHRCSTIPRYSALRCTAQFPAASCTGAEGGCRAPPPEAR